NSLNSASESSSSGTVADLAAPAQRHGEQRRPGFPSGIATPQPWQVFAGRRVVKGLLTSALGMVRPEKRQA
ncbi:MAG: hypothetical protein ACI8T1_005378, partial [Verrucomicrobiales bacterium]